MTMYKILVAPGLSDLFWCVHIGYVSHAMWPTRFYDTLYFRLQTKKDNMALSIMYCAKYVDGHTKLTRKSEASVESDRVLREH